MTGHEEIREFVYDDESRVSATSRRRGIDPKLSLQDEHVCRFSWSNFRWRGVLVFRRRIHDASFRLRVSMPCDLGKGILVQLFRRSFSLFQHHVSISTGVRSLLTVLSPHFCCAIIQRRAAASLLSITVAGFRDFLYLLRTQKTDAETMSESLICY